MDDFFRAARGIVSSGAMIPTLETERLVLREFRESDLDAYAAMSADPDVMRYIGAGKTMTRAEAWRSLAFLMGHWHLLGFGMWAATVRGDDRMIGRVGFLQPEGWPGFEIGWGFEKAAWGKGYATEGAQRALAWCREALPRQREVISLIYPENAPSIRVAERLGQKFIRMHRMNEGEVRIYGMTLGGG
jgi:RimJ/RimL family protein N-acetyltransferase